MKILLVAINAKYIHSNLAVYCLKACAGKAKPYIEIAEYTINHQKEKILADIYQRAPDFVGFSCYIWNREYVGAIIKDLHALLPQIPIWAGGPEVSYDARAFLEEFPQATGVMTGEGERSFSSLLEVYLKGKESNFSQIPGLVYRVEGEILENAPADYMNLDDIPFVYESLEDFEHRMIYYESSRGCPFSCSYCLSSIDKRVRFRSLELVFRELQILLDAKAPQVKFVDRTFNCNHHHTKAIWHYILEHDNGITNFHFEIAADLLDEEEKKLLAKMRPGLVQLEIGVQSVNPKTIQEIHRTMDLSKLKKTTAQIRACNNVHQHLDLIAGLPYENYASFAHSFNEVYHMEPQQLQLGFLKVLKGSYMQEMAKEYGLVYSHHPPYEVFSSKWISYHEILKLKNVEEMVEIYYNSNQFSNTLKQLQKHYDTPFKMYEALAEAYKEQGLFQKNHSRLARYDILRQFIQKERKEILELCEETLLFDLYLRENSKSRPQWAREYPEYKEIFRQFFQTEAKEHKNLPGYEGYQWKQIMNMAHGEVFLQDICHAGGEGPWFAVFDYKNKDPLTGNAAVFWIREEKR